MLMESGAGPVLARLGVKPLINAHHWGTSLGGSIMPPEVLDAMVEAAGHFVDLMELNRKAGEYIARITGADSGLVTAGCAAAQVLQAAACMTGTDEAKIAKLPDTTGMKNEIIIQACQRNHYDTAYGIAGANLVEVGTESGTAPRELEEAISENTAAVAYVWVMRFDGLSPEQVIEIAHDRGVPVILDAASELPPVENLSRFITMGFDMVAFSGGKGVRGPQSTGILAGRKDLMDAAWENAFFFNKPKAGIGRPMKVCKEEIVGLVAALELFVDADHETEWTDWRAKSTKIVEAVQDIPSLKSYVAEGPIYHGPNAPTAVVLLDESWTGPSPEEIEEALRTGDPPIHIGTGPRAGEIWVAPATLKDGEEEIIAHRLVELLTTP